MGTTEPAVTPSAQPPAPLGAATLDELTERLRALRVWAGQPSFAEIVDRLRHHRARRGASPAVQRVSRTTVYDCFRSGRSRLDVDLLVDVVEALGVSAGRGQRAAACGRLGDQSSRARSTRRGLRRNGIAGDVLHRPNRGARQVGRGAARHNVGAGGDGRRRQDATRPVGRITTHAGARLDAGVRCSFDDAFDSAQSSRWSLPTTAVGSS